MKNLAPSLPALSVDLVAAAMKGKGVLAQMDRGALARIEDRYRMYLAIKSRHPEIVMAPTGLIDEMWHLHMLHPRAYVRDCMAIFGDILDHDPGFGSVPSERPELDRVFARTRFLWEAEFDVPYVDPSLTGDDAPAEIHGVVMCEDKTVKPPPEKPGKQKPSQPTKPKPKQNAAWGDTGHSYRANA